MHAADPLPTSSSSRDVRASEPEADPSDPRMRAAWKTWLSALSTDAHAAMAAAFAYESLPDEGRNAWLDALETDAPLLQVSKVALYAPLLGVEHDVERRARIEEAICDDEPIGMRDVLSLRGVSESGEHVCVIATSAYLDFVQVLVCHYTPSGGFRAVSHDALCHSNDTPRPGGMLGGTPLELTPLRVVVEELAHAVLADRRKGNATPSALVAFVHLFGPVLEGDLEVG